MFTNNRVETHVNIDGGDDAVQRLAGVLEHGARIPFRAPYLPIKKGSLTVLTSHRRGGDFSDGLVYDSLENPTAIGSVDYETGRILLDERWLQGARTVQLRYLYDDKA